MGFLLVDLSMNAKDCSITKVLNICAIVLRLAMYSQNEVGKRIRLNIGGKWHLFLILPGPYHNLNNNF